MEKKLPLITNEDKKAFVAYYNLQSIIPVSQDIADTDFAIKRDSLYKILGIPLASLKGRSIIEFGPGGGLMQRL